VKSAVQILPEAKVNKTKRFAASLAVVTSLATLVSVSAFADSRPSKETNRGHSHRSEGRSNGRSERRSHDSQQSGRVGRTRIIDRSNVDRRDQGSRNRNEAPAWDRSRNDQGRNRQGGDRNNGDGNNRDRQNRGSYESFRNPSYHRNDSGRGGSHSYGRRGSYGSRQPYYANGRVSRILRSGSGFRLWISGAPFPFFIPEAYFYRNHFHIGLSIRLGGYYNPLGYYDYDDGYNRNDGYNGNDGYDRNGGYNQNDGYYRNDGYNQNDGYNRNDGYDRSGGDGRSQADLRGVVESVDNRDDTFVIRNEASGNSVTVELRDRFETVRPGDHLQLSGDWSRSGTFQAYDINSIDDQGRR
jgi:hypothetical protein